MDNVDNLTTAANVGQGGGRSHIMPREVEMLVEITKLRSEIVFIREARDKQAIEYERRLDALNHENARVQSAQDTFLPREVYEAKQDDYNKWREAVSATLIELKSARDSDKATGQIAREAQTRQFTIVIGVVGLALTILTFILNFVIQP